jgi:phosphinothricin acetyltransferase
MTVDIRFAQPGDAAQILAIYAPYCDSSVVSFETASPSREQMTERIVRISADYPWLVAEIDGRIAGYVYATRFRERAGYRWTTEVAVYVGAGDQRRGLGRALYTALFSILRSQNYHKAVAGITVPNLASVALHESVGFRPVGNFEGVGHKSGKWLSVGWWLKELQPEISNPPEPLSLGKMGIGPAIDAALSEARKLIRE